MIPVCEPLLTDKDHELVMDCLKSGWISSAGQYIDQFEMQWANYCQMKYGIAVSNGTAALYVAMGCLNLCPGDEIILPTFTIISCAQAITAYGCVPVLIDTNLHNWQMDVTQIKAKITPRTKSIMVVHTYGHPVDMDAIMDIAKQYDLKIIEDAAEAHGAEYKGRKCGSFGDISTFSFYANKLITTGEGGMVLTNSEELAEKARSLRNLCFQSSRRFFHEELGHNYRLTNIQAALGVAQIARIEEIVEKKRAIANLYTSYLQHLSNITLPVEESWAKNVYWTYGIVLDETLGSAKQLADYLAQKGIQTRPFFLGMHEQPVFHQMRLFTGETYPVAEKLAKQGLYLPNGLAINNEKIDYICSAIKAYFYQKV